MNALIQKIGSVLFLAVCASVLTACASSFNPRTDETSPVAARVQALVDANREYPRWADFPKSTEPAPTPTSIAAEVNTLRVTRGALAGEVARIDWTLTDDPAAFAEALRSRVAATAVAPATQQTQAEIDEYLRRARERGRAPPPITRRQ
ncbi:hypothetical protein [Brevundimonas sp.]|uniref:hypothetical protein n=1 Tax=Brevundimonas sp. TaxID=1871086 RepID=UPI0035AF2104